MKKFLFWLLCASIFWACNNSSLKSDEAAKPVETLHEHNKVQSTLALNNGAKWKADESTNNNVAELKLIVDRFGENESKFVADYSAVADKLQTGLDTLIKQCRMQGADHDALHLWLYPLLQNVKQLKTATTESEASKLFGELKARVYAYSQYFV